LFHGHYGHTTTKPGRVSHFSLSYAEYGPKVGFWRILDTLERHGIKATFDVGGLAAERHPNILRPMRDGGHEAAGHGWANDVHVADDDPEGELKSIRDTAAAIATGYGERPVGWVSPGSVGSARTMQYMVDEGFLWNGDDASDDVPFVRLVDGKPLVIVPAASGRGCLREIFMSSLSNVPRAITSDATDLKPDQEREMPTPAERMKAMRKRRRQQGLREIRSRRSGRSFAVSAKARSGRGRPARSEA
jgi:Polysaccharide deacetylase